MAVRDIFKVSRKTFFNPTAWFNYEALETQNKVIWSIVSLVFVKPKADTVETFEEAVTRQKLTDKDIKEGIGTYRALALVFILFSLAALGYAIYLVARYGSLTGCLLSLAVMALFAAQSFKYDFWALQMSRRQLGLTFSDWKRHYLGD